MRIKNWQLLALQIIAVFCSYLIWSTTGATALEIRIFTSGGQQSTTTIPKFSDMIQKELSYPYQQNYQYLEMKLSSKSASYVIKKIYLFRCKDLDPVSCIEKGVNPVISVNPGSSSLVFDETYKWDDVSSNNVGNFLAMVKLDIAGKEVWTSSWDKVTKTGIRNFYNENNDVDRLDLYIKGASADVATSYIENYYAIPSDQMSRSIFESVGGSGVTKLYDLSGNKDRLDPSGTGIPSLKFSSMSGNIFNKSTDTWDFIIAADGKAGNPVVFYSTEAGPPITGGAKLVIDDWSPQIVTCYSGEVIKATMHAENASSIGYFQSYYYTIDGVKANEGTMTCSLVSPNASIYSYQCSIPVETFPACTAPGTSTIKVFFNYQGGVQLSGSFPVTLKAPSPSISVTSLSPTPFDCGIDNEITAKLQVSNPGEGAPEMEYTFDGENFNTLTCTGSGGSYTCTVPESRICELVQESLSLVFKFTYGETEVLSLPSTILVTFPPPSVGIDTVTPQAIDADKTTAVSVLLHVNYPDFITYNENNFNYKYLDKPFAPATCTLETSYSNIKYYRCNVALAIPSGRQGVETLAFRLDGFAEGKPKQLTANAFYEIMQPPPEPRFTIISTSSPVDCTADNFLTVNIKAENVDMTTLHEKVEYTTNSSGYYYAPCTASANIMTCSLPAKDLCDQMQNVLGIQFRHMVVTADKNKTYYSNSQKVYFNLPEPHMQVYAVSPDSLPAGAKTAATVSLYLQYPNMVGSSPAFLYTYLGKINQKMTCTKVSSTANRDFYDCANTNFEIPADYSESDVPVVFSVQGTTISFPFTIPVVALSKINPWLEIVASTPSRIEVVQGNETSASFYVTIHNAAESELKHQATVITNSMIASGTCKEADVVYDFNCDVKIKASKTTNVGANTANLTLRVEGKKTYDVTNSTTVYVLGEQARVDIQSASPETLYCEGNKQQNPDAVKITANAKNVASFTVLEEQISFNELTIDHTAKYCSQQAQTITCNIPTDKLFEKVTCGQDELAPGQGSKYYPLTLTFLVRAGNEQLTISGTKDISVSARPLEPYLDIVDNDISGGTLQNPINCLGSKSIKLGDSGYVRIMYADLLHPEPKEDDLVWSYKLEAQDDKGKLTQGTGVSPEANATVCKFITYQKVGTHRIEDYECSLYVTSKMFQRCEMGEGTIKLYASSGTGKKAEGVFDIYVIRDESPYQIEMEILGTPPKDINCQIQTDDGQCTLASYSQLNVSLRIYNRNADVGIPDLQVYDFDANLTGKTVNANLRSLGNCQKTSQEANKYICPFEIGPTIKLPDTPEYKINKENPDTQEFPPISLGAVQVAVYIKYLDNKVQKTLTANDGTITIHPKLLDSYIDYLKRLKEAQDAYNKTKAIMVTAIRFLSLCATCVMVNKFMKEIFGDAPSICNSDNDCTKNDPNAKCVGNQCMGTTGGQNSTQNQNSASALKTQCENCINGGGCWCKNDNKCGNTVGSNCVQQSPAPFLICTAMSCGSYYTAANSPSDYQPETSGAKLAGSAVAADFAGESGDEGLYQPETSTLNFASSTSPKGDCERTGPNPANGCTVSLEVVMNKPFAGDYFGVYARAKCDKMEEVSAPLIKITDKKSGTVIVDATPSSKCRGPWGSKDYECMVKVNYPKSGEQTLEAQLYAYEKDQLFGLVTMQEEIYKCEGVNTRLTFNVFESVDCNTYAQKVAKSNVKIYGYCASNDDQCNNVCAQKGKEATASWAWPPDGNKLKEFTEQNLPCGDQAACCACKDKEPETFGSCAAPCGSEKCYDSTKDKCPEGKEFKDDWCSGGANIKCCVPTGTPNKSGDATNSPPQCKPPCNNVNSGQECRCEGYCLCTDSKGVKTYIAKGVKCDENAAPNAALPAVTGNAPGSAGAAAPAALDLTSIKTQFDNFGDYFSSGNWWKVVIGALGIALLILLVATKLFKWFEEKEGESEYTSALKWGIKWGIVCGAAAPLIEAVFPKEQKGTAGDISNVLQKILNFPYKVCKFLMDNLSTIMMLVNIYFQYQMFEYCMKNLEDRVRQTYNYGAASTTSAAASQAYSSVNMANEMMQCFSMMKDMTCMAMGAFNSLTFSGQGIFSDGVMEVTQDGSRKKTGDTIYNGKLEVRVSGFCEKVGRNGKYQVSITAVMEDGTTKVCKPADYNCGSSGVYTPYYTQSYYPSYYSSYGSSYGSSSGCSQYMSYNPSSVNQNILTLYMQDTNDWNICESGGTIKKVRIEGPWDPVVLNFAKKGGTTPTTKKKSGDTCANNVDCESVVCCYTSWNDLTITGKKVCVNDPVACICKYPATSGIGLCKGEDYKNATTPTCDGKAECPNEKYYCCR
jgi:hypothetical protein